MTKLHEVHVYRGQYIESSHQVHIAVVSAEGKLIGYYGDPFRLTFGRSSLKPFQAAPLVESGAIETYGLTQKELALFCASHNSEDFHRQGVKDVLAKIDLEESALQCGTHIPRDKDSYKKLIKSGGELTPVYHNCSGKHAGMLAGSLKKALDIDHYRDPDHPYQLEIIEVISNASDYAKEKIATSVDGCGLPVHRLPLYNLALAFTRLAVPNLWANGSEQRKASFEKIREAMTKYPEMVAGTDRYDTDLMRVFNGRLVAKVGAEGVHCIGDKDTGIGIALKVEDGNERATNVASMEVLHQLGIGTENAFSQLSEYHHAPVRNARKEKIGEMIPSFTLKRI
ncbi:asparaginase [Aquibacillus albus]|uniref:L-asparaginase II n=1 Tax=Aquibacillus albus TaxID=1168171 RepID=A0ABS2N399_9BACI|nr:asparaginase [Aquibacillus albus]MBM7572584.1 L-asparaginase II [Aquibacillus albus]